MPTDPRQAAIESAVRATALRLLARDQTVAQVVAALAVVAGEAPITPRESIAVVRQSRRERMVAELERLERQGRGRAAPMVVARDFASDARDPIEVASLARKLRRWRRKNSDTVRLPSPKSNTG